MKTKKLIVHYQSKNFSKMPGKSSMTLVIFGLYEYSNSFWEVIIFHSILQVISFNSWSHFIPFSTMHSFGILVHFIHETQKIEAKVKLS